METCHLPVIVNSSGRGEREKASVLHLFDLEWANMGRQPSFWGYSSWNWTSCMEVMEQDLYAWLENPICSAGHVLIVWIHWKPYGGCNLSLQRGSAQFKLKKQKYRILLSPFLSRSVTPSLPLPPLSLPPSLSYGIWLTTCNKGRQFSWTD